MHPKLPDAKKLVRFGLLLLFTLLLAEALCGLLLIFPQPFFHFSHTTKNLHLYSDAPLTASEKAQVEDLAQLLSRETMNIPSINHRIFLSNSSRRYAFYGFLVNKNSNSQGFNVEPTGNIFINKPFIDGIRRQYGPAYSYTLLEGDLSHIIAHEIVHTLVTKKLGFWKSRALPAWKKEGYAEYLAAKLRSSDELSFNFRDRYAHFQRFSPDTISPVRLHYLESQLLLHYLMEIERMDFDSVMHTSLTEAEVFDQLKAWQATP